MLMKYYKASHWIRPVSSPKEADLLVVGSVLQGVPEQNSPIILGSGILTDTLLRIPKAKVYAVRGLLTKDRLGLTDEVAVGDPGLLISRLLPSTQFALSADAGVEKPIGIVPHWKHYSSPRLDCYRSDPRFKFINPRCRPERVAQEICSCSAIIASSLHALIFADAYGVPNVRLRFDDGLRDVSDYKYDDYYSAIDRTGFAARSITPEEIGMDLTFDTSYQKNVARVQENLDKAFRAFRAEQCSQQSTSEDKICCLSAPKVSVIVPVYKARGYISDLLESLLNQTLREMEFIFVDDRGGDGTFDIVREAAKNDSRIVCLDNGFNKGAGASRNAGLTVARGEYVAFADADDLVDVDFYEKLYKKAKEKNYLVVKGASRRLFDDGTITESNLNACIAGGMASRKTMLSLFHYEHWSAIYLRDFVLSSGARYAEDLRYGEDNHFLMLLMLNVRVSQYAMLNDTAYIYRIHGSSVTNSKDYTVYLDQILKNAEKKFTFLMTQEDSAEIAEYLGILFDNQIGNILDDAQSGGCSDDEIYAYLGSLGNFLKQWKDSGRLYAPRILAAAYDELNHRPDHFYILRRVYRELKQEKESQAALKKSVHTWQQAIEQRFCKPLDVLEGLLECICRFRMEVYREGGSEGSFTLSGAEELQTSSPAWLCRGGYGVMLVGRTGKYTLRVAAGESCRLTLRFRGLDVRDGEKRIPAWVDITSLRIDGREYEARAVWHDKAYTVTLDVSEGQLVTLELRAEPHLHTESEAEHLLHAFYPKLEYTSDARKILLGNLQSRIAALRGVSLPSLQAVSDDLRTQLTVLRSNHEALQQKHLTLQGAHECLKKATAESDKRLSALGKTLVDQSATIAELASTIEAQKSDIIALSARLRESDRVLTATRRQLTTAERIQQLSIFMPRLRWRYQILRLKKTFSFGRRRERYKQKIKAIKPLLREYKELVRGMRDMSR